jgi:hypothetical protein
MKDKKVKEEKENTPNNKEEDFEWGKHPNSLKALKKYQFPKGVSGNVMGRKPTFESLSKALKELGEEETYDWDNNSKGTRKEQVLERIWIDGIRGDFKKIQLLAWLGCLE